VEYSLEKFVVVLHFLPPLRVYRLSDKTLLMGLSLWSGNFQVEGDRIYRRDSTSTLKERGVNKDLSLMHPLARISF
jgi:hypothetical protein